MSRGGGGVTSVARVTSDTFVTSVTTVTSVTSVTRDVEWGVVTGSLMVSQVLSQVFALSIK